MFKWLKKNRWAPLEPSSSAIVPRIKNLNFLSPFTAIEAPVDQIPITLPLVGELVVAFAFDLPDAFVMTTPAHLSDLDISTEDMLPIAMDNLTREALDIQIQKIGSVYQIVTGGSLEACTLLISDFWDSFAEQIFGSLVVAVPHRDIVVACSSDDFDALTQMKEIVAEVSGTGDNHILTSQFLIWGNGNWSLFN